MAGIAGSLADWTMAIGTIQIKDEKHSEIWKVNSCSCINLVTTALDAEVNDVMEGIQEEMLAAMSAPLHTIPHQDC